MNFEKVNPGISGGPAPFGFKREKNELVPDPEEAPVRKLMFELFLKHKRKKTVARLLNETGYRTRRGKLFSDTAVERMLTDPVAKGLKRVSSEKGEFFIETEAIVSEEIWNQCSRILTDQKKSRKKTARRPARHFFAGSVFCECGGKMYVPSEGFKYVCQKCRNKISADDLEFIYCSELKSFSFSEQDLYRYACLYDHDPDVKDKKDPLKLSEKERKDTRQETDCSEAAEVFSPVKKRNLNFYWQTLSSDEKIQLIEIITDSITVNGSEVNITFRHPSF